MPSSTSSFDTARLPVADAAGSPGSSRRISPLLVGLLATIVVFLAALEGITRFVIERHSKVERMVNQEYAEALQIRRSPAGPKQLLILGNSLVGHGINLDELKTELPPYWHAHRFWIYNTLYDDWYFGLRRMFAEGSRPDVVAIVFAGMHWYASGTRGDYVSRYLYQTGDLRQIQSQLDLDNTATTGILLARYSSFYALRSDIRKVILQKLLPDLPQMYDLFKPGAARQISEAQMVDLVANRIGKYRDIAHRYGTRLVLIVPPIPRPGHEHQDAISKAAARAGVPLVMPMSYSDVPKQQFADDMHLTAAGATRFTAAVAKEMVPEINRALQR